MESEYHHRILIVDDDTVVSVTMAHILQPEKILCSLSNSGESALEEIKTAKAPFSVIIANQSLSGMQGTKLLEYAKKLVPETSRFLMATHSEFAAIIDAVNKGLIQRYIVKPLVNEDFFNTIKSGIKLFDSFFEHERLMNLAKHQNTQLYELSCRLMEAAKSHTKEIHDLEKEIGVLEKNVRDLSFEKPVNPEMLLKIIETGIKSDDDIDPQKVQALFSGAVRAIYDEFNDLAKQRGFEMPEITREVP